MLRLNAGLARPDSPALDRYALRVTDFFQLLGLARKPWLDAEDVKARFLELSAAAHPDRAHGGGGAGEANKRFAELNAAAACLREPRDRLNHLLELETGEARAATANLSKESMEFFPRVASVLREADGLIAERARVVSPMLQAQLFALGLDLTERVEALQREVGEMRGRADAQLQEISARWPASKPIARLRELAHTYATLLRWETQLRERYAGLAAGNI